MQTIDYRITGMDCPDCARTIERGVATLDGVASCSIVFAAAQLQVAYDPARLTDAQIRARVAALGYGVADTGPEAATPAAAATAPVALPIAFGRFLLGHRAAGLPLLIGAALLALAFALELAAAPDAAPLALELAALLVAGAPVARSALQALFLSRRITIGLLMTIAAVGAVIIGEAAEAATVLVLYALGEALEGFTMQRARDSLQGLLRLAPAEALRLAPCIDCEEHMGRDGYTGGPCPWCGVHEQRIPVAEVAVGDTVRVPPGERVPLDGTVLRGFSAVNQQHVTGESMPLDRGAGDPVYAGSINGDGALDVRVTAPASGSLLSRIATLVGEAQAQRAPVERFIDRFAAWYTPAIVAVAALVAILPPLVAGQPFWNTADGAHGWLYRALALLVVACPCALVISTPVTIVSALSAAHRAGVLIKGGAALEALRKVRVVAFDKTGTLTTGRPHVTGVRCADGCCLPDGCAHCNDVLALAAAVERHSAHPLAGAVTRAADTLVYARYEAETVTALPGRGINGRVAGQMVTVGSHALFDAEHMHDPALCAQVAEAESRGQTVLMVCNCDDGGVQGYISIADLVRPEARAAVAALHAGGVERVVVLTGDNAAVGEAVARGVGADDARSSLLPADKLTAVRELQERHGPVAMVGDGVNDTPALAAATVGIAMGAAGSAQALEAADVALLHDDLERLPWLLRLSRRASAIIGQNIALSLVSKLLFLMLALGGVATLWMAVLADTGVALVVILNGMRLLRGQQ
jgi:Cd2+/Zn2+-exporting ATPase